MPDNKPKFDKEKITAYLAKESVSATKLLIMGFGLSLIGALYYLFDLFSHFTIQYAIGGLILAPTLAFGGKKRWACVALFIGIFSLVESRMNLQNPLQFSPNTAPTAYKVVTYNHNYGRVNLDTIHNWLLKEENDFDVVVLQEATSHSVDMAKELSELYPYQIHEPRDHAFGMVVLSRHPFIDTEKISLIGPYYASLAIKIKVHADRAKEPIAIYALHPHPPTGPLAQAQRDFELLKTSEKVASDDSKNIIMIGDWNLTPYAPMFKKVLSVSGLNYQAFGFLQNPTWPSFNFLPFLKISIDHVIYSDNLALTQKTAGPAFMSDHHSLIVELAERS